MEEPKPSSGAAAGSRRGLWIVVAIVVAIVAIASATIFWVLPALQGPGYAKFTLVTLDFGYDQITNPDVHSEHRVKVNQPIWVVMRNDGENDHEFLLYANKDAALVSADYALSVALADHPDATTNATEKQAALDEYDTLHDGYANLTRYNNIDKDVVPGETVDLLFVIHVPGTYYFVCHQVDTTVTPWMIHQAHGMWGTLIVEA